MLKTSGGGSLVVDSGCSVDVRDCRIDVTETDLVIALRRHVSLIFQNQIDLHFAVAILCIKTSRTRGYRKSKLSIRPFVL